MTRNDLQHKLREIETEYESNKKAAYKEFALSNNPHKIGDIITDHISSLKIEKIGVYISYGDCECTYTGIQLNKDGKPSKKQDHTTIFQRNIGT